MPAARPQATLSQYLGVLGGVKTRTERALTDAHHAAQKLGPLQGIARTYSPKDELGDELPPERTLVQVRGGDLVRAAGAALSELFDTIATVDATNASPTARADVVLDNGDTLARGVPAVTLLALEKKLTDIATFVGKLPTLDAAEEWTWDEATATWRTQPTTSFKMKKVLFNHVVAEATDKHPAQVQVHTEDAPIGTWTTVKFSGALPAAQVRAMQARVVALQRAVRFARERANTAPVIETRIGESLTEYVFGPTPM